MRDCESIEEAIAYLEYLVCDEEYIDNYRYAFVDDKEEVRKYKLQQLRGCCGFFDSIVKVNGRKMLIGCNYGH